MIDAIFHLADIHIRMLKRHTEYEYAFEQTFKEAKRIKEKYNNPIIVIAGDIVHAKVDISPELIEMVGKFIGGLSDILPTYVYPGNHDANLNNPSRMDTLEPIMKILSMSKNCYYIKNSDIIEFENIRLAHFSIFEPREAFPDIKLLSNDKLNFAVYHGAVNNSYTDQGFKLENKNVTTSLFDGFDGVLLGDIHKRQCLQTKSKDKPEIWYPGSFVQQNHGESLDNHGGLIWEITDTINVIPWDIEHAYGYFTIDIDKGDIKTNLSNIPPKPRIRLNVTNTDFADLNVIKSELRNQFNVTDIQIQKNKSKLSGQVIPNQINIGNMHDIEYQNNLIKDYLKINYSNEIDSEIINDILEVNRSINKKILTSNKIRGLVWKIKRFEFSSLFSYGENNYIDFETLEGNVGIFAPNASGKSSLLDSILFALFDKTSRTNSANLIINNKKLNLYSKIILDINGIEYTIEKHGNKYPTGSVKVVTEFTRNIDGTIESLNGDDRKQTNKIIEKYIGTFDDFILTALSLQSTGTNYIDLSQTQRKQTLYQFLDITIFEELFNLAKEESKDLKRDITKIRNSNIDSRYSENIDKLKEIKTKIKSARKEKQTIENHIDKIKKQIIQLEVNITDTLSSDYDIEGVEKHIEQLKETISLSEDKKQIISNEYIELENKYNEYYLLIQQDDISTLNKKKDEYNSLVENQMLLESDIKILESKLNHLLINQDHLSHNEYNPECDVCQKNNITQKEKYNNIVDDIELTKNEINTKKTSLFVQKQEISNFNFSDEYYDIYLNNFNLYTKYQQDLYQKSDKLNSLINKINQLNSELELYEKKKKIYYDNEYAIKQNIKTNKEISLLNKEIEKYSQELDIINNNVNNLNRNLGYYEKELSNINETLNELKSNEAKYKVYDFYLRSISRDGIPKDIIDKTLPKIEQEVNRILNQLVSFNVLFNISGNVIETYITYGDSKWLLDLSSGMEKFISSLAIRVAMINVTNLPKPNFIAIDEGWGTLSSENMNNIFMLLDYLKTEFDFTLIISHLDSMRDIVDKLIDISKIDGYSKILV